MYSDHLCEEHEFKKRSVPHEQSSEGGSIRCNGFTISASHENGANREVARLAAKVVKAVVKSIKKTGSVSAT